MTEQEWVKSTLTIAQKEIQAKIGRLKQSKLRFYPDNPRIHTLIQLDESDPSQADIERRLSSMDHVKQLVQSIRANGGVIDPLIVRDGDYVVLEGNSRLAAYRLLAKNDPIKWGMVKVKLLSKDIGEDIVFALLGEYHIIGRKDWAPYEQAGYLWRRVTKHNIPESTVADEMGLPRKDVGHLIKVYTFMLEQKDTDVNRWSYYDELLKSRYIKRISREKPDFLKVVVQKIKSGEIARAVDVRDKVGKICKAGAEAVETFQSGEETIEKAYAKATEGDQEWLNRLTKFRNHLCERGVEREFHELKPELRKTCIREMTMIVRIVENLLRKLS